MEYRYMYTEDDFSRKQRDSDAKEFVDFYRENKELWAQDRCSADLIKSEMSRTSGFVFFKVAGVSYFDYPDSDDSIYTYDLLKTLYNAKIKICAYYIYNEGVLSLYIGTYRQSINILKHILFSIFPDIELSMDKGDESKFAEFTEAELSGKAGMIWTGALRGIVGLGDNKRSLIDKVIQGCRGVPCVIKVFSSFSKRENIEFERLESGKNGSACSTTGREQVSYIGTRQVTFSSSVEYYEVLQQGKVYGESEKRYSEGIGEGMWNTVVTIGVPFERGDSDYISNMVSGIMCSELYTQTSLEPIHFIKVDSQPTNGAEDIHTELTSKEVSQPTNGAEDLHTELTSKEVAAYYQFPTRDTFGFKVSRVAEFDEERNNYGDISIGKIVSHSMVSPNAYNISSSEMTRHCLIVGLTGSGKTNTTMNLACEMRRNKKPIMVIEPAKADYWKLYKYGFDDLKIFGTEAGKGRLLQINPFECHEGVSIQSHIDAIFAAFKASFSLYPPMPYVLENAIISIYKDRGWDIAQNINVRKGDRVFPTIENLYDKIPVVTKQMGYSGEQERNIMGALHARINSLRIGTKGNILNVAHSVPDEDLFVSNTVVELDDIGDDDAKAFIMSLLLIRLSEIRRVSPDSKKLIHTLFIEEAHRLLKNVQSSGGNEGDPRANAVEYFCNLLAEMRSKGQGFVIVDQLPAKLAVDLIENTNLKIVHRTVAERERVLMGGAMNMTDSQQAYLSCLKQGVAAVYSEGDIRPKLVKPTNVDSYIIRERADYSFKEVTRAISGNSDNLSESINQKDIPTICSMCPKRFENECSCYVDKKKISAKTRKYVKDLADAIRKEPKTKEGRRINYTGLFERVSLDLCDSPLSDTFCFIKDLCDKLPGESLEVCRQFIDYLSKCHI